MKDDELWFKTRFTIIWLPFWGDETQHAASLQLETKLGEKSKLTYFANEASLLWKWGIGGWKSNKILYICMTG